MTIRIAAIEVSHWHAVYDAAYLRHLVAIGSSELHDPVLHREDGVAACDLPLAVGTVTREAITDLDGAENAAGGTKEYGGVVLNRPVMRPPAQLGASNLRWLSGQIEKHVHTVRTEVSQAPAAGLDGIEHP